MVFRASSSLRVAADKPIGHGVIASVTKRSGTHTSRRPDLAVFIPSYAGGGAERVAMFVTRTLVREGLEVDLVVARNRGVLRDDPLPGVNKVNLKAPNELLAAPAWIRYLKRVSPRCAMSMIHSANLISGIGAYFVPEVPLIVSIHYALRCEPEAQWWVRRAFGMGPERSLYRRAAHVLGVSRGLASEAAEVFALPPEKVSTIYNPHEPARDSSAVPPEHEVFFQKPVVLGIGRLAPQKHFSMLIEAFARVAASHDLHLVVLGQGPDLDALTAQAKSLGLANRVFFPGFVANPQAYLRRARIFASTSRNEGFGIVLMEAMDAGTAIVSTDCPFGPSEVVDEGRFGRLVPVGDTVAFAGALESELESLDVGHVKRRAERADWLEQFKPERITRQYLDLVRDVITKNER